MNKTAFYYHVDNWRNYRICFKYSYYRIKINKYKIVI
jgi:hypothetical protein